MESTTSAVPVQKRPRQQYGISPEVFVRAWQTSSSIQEVADKLSKYAGRSYPKETVASRASSYRTRGVKLKRMSRPGAPKLDAEKLNVVASEDQEKQAA